MHSIDRMKSYLPSFYFLDPLFKKIIETQGNEIENLYINLEDLKNQFFVQTATWGLKHWEEFCGTITNESLSHTQRRGQIIAKLSLVSSVTFNGMKRLVKGFSDSTELYEYPSEYKFEIIFNSKSFFNLEISKLVETVEEVKPAHLDFNVVLQTPAKIQIKPEYIRHINDYAICGTFQCGTYPEPSTLGRFVDAKVQHKAELYKNQRQYNLTGTFQASEGVRA